jgi:hypothetical protein
MTGTMTKGSVDGCNTRKRRRCLRAGGGVGRGGGVEWATEIVDELDRRLRRTRMRVEELVPRLESIGQADAVPAGLEDIDDVEIIEELVIEDEGEEPPGLF